MTRVALVTSSFLPRVGGVEEHVLRSARELRRQGHDVAIWAVDQGDDVPTSVDGMVIRYLPCPMPSRSLAGVGTFASAFPAAARQWWRAWDIDRPQAIHIQCYGPNGPWATLLARVTRTPLILSSHGETYMDEHDVFGSGGLMPSALKWSLRRARRVTGCSAYTLEDLRSRFGLPASRGVVVPNGIDLDEPSGHAPPETESGYFLAIGRQVEVKGFDLLLDAYAQFVRECPDAPCLMLAGDGPEHSALKAQAERLDLAGRVLFPGRLDRPKVVAAMAGATALIVPSRVEAFGIVVLEGWRAGIPVIVTTHGGPPEFVDDAKTGLVVDPLNASALAQAMERILRNPQEAAAMAGAGRDKAEDYPWSRVAADYGECYRAVGAD